MQPRQQQPTERRHPDTDIASCPHPGNCRCAECALVAKQRQQVEADERRVTERWGRQAYLRQVERARKRAA